MGKQHGVRARLAWYRRRLRGEPQRVFAVDPANEASFFSAVLDPRPPWRKPAPPDWSQWQNLGATADGPPDVFRRR